MIVKEPQDIIARWLCERIGYVPTAEFIAFANWDSERREIIGAIGYDGWSVKMVEMHVAGEPDTYWLTKNMLKMAFHFPFNVHGREIIASRVSSSNIAAMRLNEKLGFKEQCRIEGGTQWGDLVIFAMNKSDCKWLNMKDRLREAA